MSASHSYKPLEDKDVLVNKKIAKLEKFINEIAIPHVTSGISLRNFFTPNRKELQDHITDDLHKIREIKTSIENSSPTKEQSEAVAKLMESYVRAISTSTYLAPVLKNALLNAGRTPPESKSKAAKKL